MFTIQTLAKIAVSTMAGLAIALSSPAQAQAPVPTQVEQAAVVAPADATLALSAMDLHVKGMSAVYVLTFHAGDTDNGLGTGQFTVRSVTQPDTFYLFQWAQTWQA